MDFCNTHTSLRFAKFALLGSVSALSISGAALAQPAQAPAASTEEILVTGSLIRGAAAVGVPVTALGAEEFRETGALTVSDVLRSIPSIQVEASTSIANAGGQINRSIGIDVHTLNSTSSPRTLMMINSMRFPPAGHGADRFDPSIIPQLAVERVDVLADGASATYGSDAIAGVVNVIMRRGYDGAMTQLRYGAATEGGANKALFSQLYGTVWDSGDITVSYEWYDEKGISGSAREDQFSFDYTPWGLDNRRLVSHSVPPVFSIGAPNGGALVTGCTNCFSLPKGTGWNYGDTTAHTNPTTPGSAATIAWTSIASNTGAGQNQLDPYFFADVLAAQQRNAATMTFDQQLFDGVEMFVDAFYQNRRVQQRYPALANPVRNVSNLRGLTVPTVNPYYPTGAPAGIRVSYNISAELQPKLSASEVSGRWATGLDFDLPYEWNGRASYAFNEEKNTANIYDIANNSNVSAALGNTVAALPASGAIPGQAAFSKPANVPYLNVFCDPFAFQCNSPTTLAYLSGYRNYSQHYNITEFAVTLDGPLFDLPGGPVMAAIGGNKYSHTYSFVVTQNFGPTYSTAFVDKQPDNQKEEVWAAYGQINVPIVGETNALPFVRSMEVELSLRHDRYERIGNTTNPKVGVNIAPFDGLALRGSWGTSFRAPAFADASGVAGAQVQPINSAAGAGANTIPVCVTGETSPVPGTAAEALVKFYSPTNPTCAGFAAATGSLFPGAITLRGGAGIASLARGGTTALSPEEADNYSLGFQYRPTDNFLAGLTVDFTYFNIKINKLLQSLDASGGTLRDPSLGFTVILPSDPNYTSLVSSYVRHPRAEVINEPNVRFIVDAAVRNTGYVKTDGIDFSVSYDWDLGDLGIVNAGMDGSYFLRRITQNVAGTAATDAYVGKTFACLFCAPPIPPRFRHRTTLGWSSSDEAWSANLSANYTSHYFHNQVAPPVPTPNYSNLAPAHVTMDVSLGYNTGNETISEYLNNLDIRLVVNNVMNKMPPFMYKVSTGGSNPAAFDISQNPVGRVVTVVLTKTW